MKYLKKTFRASIDGLNLDTINKSGWYSINFYPQTLGGKKYIPFIQKGEEGILSFFISSDEDVEKMIRYFHDSIYDYYEKLESSIIEDFGEEWFEENDFI